LDTETDEMKLSLYLLGALAEGRVHSQVRILRNPNLKQTFRSTDAFRYLLLRLLTAAAGITGEIVVEHAGVSLAPLPNSVEPEKIGSSSTSSGDKTKGVVNWEQMKIKEEQIETSTQIFGTKVTLPNVSLPEALISMACLHSTSNTGTTTTNAEIYEQWCPFTIDREMRDISTTLRSIKDNLIEPVGDLSYTDGLLVWLARVLEREVEYGLNKPKDNATSGNVSKKEPLESWTTIVEVLVGAMEKYMEFNVDKKRDILGFLRSKIPY
jgi:hypothetical protein